MQQSIFPRRLRQRAGGTPSVPVEQADKQQAPPSRRGGELSSGIETRLLLYIPLAPGNKGARGMQNHFSRPFPLKRKAGHQQKHPRLPEPGDVSIRQYEGRDRHSERQFSNIGMMHGMHFSLWISLWPSLSHLLMRLLSCLVERGAALGMNKEHLISHCSH